MKEAEIFENWINNLSEGTWALPETPEQQEKLNQLMSAELIVGPDAINATEQLYDLVGDDELFDILNDLADRSEGRANCWDDSDVQRRLAELGVQTPQSTRAEPADVDQDEAPALKEGNGGPQITPGMKTQYGTVVSVNDDIVTVRASNGELTTVNITDIDQAMAEGDNTATFVEDRELSTMLKYAGVPVKEGVLNDDTRNTWDHLLDRFRHEVEQFRQGSDLDSDLYDALFDYYSQHGAMPYRVQKAKDGDPHQWVSNRLADDLGMNENLISPQIMPVSEGSCNMTMEGSYCPEHGLAECGGMYEDSRTARQRTADAAQQRTAPLPHQAVKLNPAGMSQSQIDDRMTSVGFIPGTRDHATAGEAYRTANPNIKRPVSKPLPRKDVQGTDLDPIGSGVDEDGGAVGMPYSMGEGTDDPINSNSAMTGSYYEGKESKSQEGDALLARIKSLALLR